MSSPARACEVTAGGMTRVAAVVAAMVEAAQVESPSEAEGSLNDLIAKAAQVVERHAGATREMRKRGQVQQGRARESLRAAAGGMAAPNTHRLDIVR